MDFGAINNNKIKWNKVKYINVLFPSSICYNWVSETRDYRLSLFYKLWLSYGGQKWQYLSKNKIKLKTQ